MDEVGRERRLRFPVPEALQPRDGSLESRDIPVVFVVAEVGDRVEPDRKALRDARSDELPDGLDGDDLVVGAVDNPESGIRRADDDPLRGRPGDGDGRGKHMRVFKN